MDRKSLTWLPHSDELSASDSAAEKSDRVDGTWLSVSDATLPSWPAPIHLLTTAHDISILYLEGEIGIPEFHCLEHVVESLRKKGFLKFVFSFDQVDHLNYRVFQETMRIAKALRHLSGDIRFTGINTYLYHIFLFAGADQTIDHFANLEEAILSFHNTHGRHWH